MYYRKTVGEKIGFTILYIVLILCSLIFAYPFYYLLVNSFNGMVEVNPSYLFPLSSLTVANYTTIFTDLSIVNACIVSVARTLIGTVVTVFNSAMCAYALRKRNICMRNFYLMLFTVPGFFGGGLIPGYLNFRQLGLLNNFLIYILPHAFGFFYVIIFMSNFNSLPGALEDAATIDGAGYFTVFFRIFIPVSLPSLATIALFCGVGQWDSWFDSLFYTTDPKLMTLAAYLMKVVRNADLSSYSQQIAHDVERSASTSLGIQFATMVVATVPITLIYPFLQKYFVKGLTIGSVKE